MPANFDSRAPDSARSCELPMPDGRHALRECAPQSPICPLWARMRTPRSVCEFLIDLPSAKPFIARIRVDAEPTAKLTPVRPLLHRKPHKLSPLIHSRQLAPRHGFGLPICQIHAL